MGKTSRYQLFPKPLRLTLLCRRRIDRPPPRGVNLD